MRRPLLSNPLVLTCLVLATACGSENTPGETSLNVIVDDPDARVLTAVYDILCDGEHFQDQLEPFALMEWRGLVSLPAGECDAVLVGFDETGSPICANVTSFSVPENGIAEPPLDLDCSQEEGESSDDDGPIASVVTTTSVGSFQWNECNLIISGLDQLSNRRRDGGVTITVDIDGFCTQSATSDAENE